MPSVFSKVSIIGGGQIGTSIAEALRASDPNVEIVVVDKKDAVTIDVETKTEIPNETAFYKALKDKSISEEKTLYTTDMANVAGSGLVILATPISEFGNVIKSALLGNAIVTDIGSVKEASMGRVLSALPKGVDYVPGHIFNGEAGSGPLTANPKLFDNWPMFLIPGVGSPTAFKAVGNFFKSLGARIVPVTAQNHDRVVGTMSHLQNGLMFALEQTEGFYYGPHKYATPDIGDWIHGVRGMTRVAEAGPDMWEAIFQDNRENVLRSASAFRKILVETAEAVAPNSLQSRFMSLIKGKKPPTIDEIVDNAHSYAKETRGNRGGAPVDPAQYMGKNDLANSAFAALMSVAAVRNLQRVETETGMKLAAIANPSLKDGLTPVGVDPAAVKALFRQHGPELQFMARQYLKQLDVLLNAIKHRDGETIKQYVAAARTIRLDIKSGKTAQALETAIEHDPHDTRYLPPEIRVVDKPIRSGLVPLAPSMA